MARDFSRAFYHSREWKEVRESYFRLRHGLCEKCMRRGRVTPGEIVHHKVHLTPGNIYDPKIATDPSNLELLCRKCHGQEHSEAEGMSEPRVAFDEFGNTVRMEGTDG